MIETKVTVAGLTSLVGAVLVLLVQFGVSLTADQHDAILAVLVAAWPFITAPAAWLAPHTTRPDAPAQLG